MNSPHPSWRDAWTAALYADEGFYRTGRPIDHFRTSAHLGLFAKAISRLVRLEGSATVVDLAAGGGEMLTALHALVGDDVELIGVEISARPTFLPPSIGWLPALPDRIDGLLIANEWLDNIPCDVVEVDDAGVVREVLVDPKSGEEALGNEVDSVWLREWWPIAQPGERAEIGDTRDAAWADAVARVSGTAIAIDYGHTRDNRPPYGSLRSYVSGRETDVIPDGQRDVTAHVAVDSVAAKVGATIRTQREALGRLGLDASRPPLELATTDPTAYLNALAAAGEAGELVATSGLGDFWWLITDTRGHGTLTA